MSQSAVRVADSSLYNSPSPALRPPPRRSHSPSRSSSLSSTSSSLTFSKEEVEDVSAPKERTSALAAQLRVSLSQREKSVSRSTSLGLDPPHWTSHTRYGDEEGEDDSHHGEHSIGADDVSVVMGVSGGRLPYTCKVFIHRAIVGFIATSRHRRVARSFSSSSSSPSSDSPSLSPSSSSLSSGDSSSLPCVTFHVNESCSLQRLSCELISACLSSSQSHTQSHSVNSPPLDVLSLSKSFRLVAATPSGRVDEDCPALSPFQAVHHFNLTHFLFVLSHPDQPIPWALWSLPCEEIHIGPRTTLSSLPSLFLQGCAAGDVERVMLLLDEGGVSVEAVDEEGRSGLHLAAAHGHVAVVHLLCKRGMDVDRRDRRGRTAVLCGVQRGSVECVEALLMWGCSVWVEDVEGRTAVSAAKDCGVREMEEVIEEALRDGEPEDGDEVRELDWERH